MEDLVIKRRCWKRVRSVYTLRISQEYLDSINETIVNYIVNPENFKPLTLEEIKQIAYDRQDPIVDKDPDSRLLEEFDFYCSRVYKGEPKRTWRSSLLWFVKDAINEDLWNSDEGIENEEIDDSEDEVFCGDADAVGADDNYVF